MAQTQVIRLADKFLNLFSVTLSDTDFGIAAIQNIGSVP